MILREKELFAPIKAMLKAEGWKVFAEVAFYSSAIDVVAVRGDERIAIEMKTTLNAQVVRQAARERAWVHRAYVAVPTFPTDASVMRCQNMRVGIIRVVGDKTFFMMHPETNDKPVRFPLDLSALVESEEDEAGLPTMKGVSAAWAAQEAVERYVRLHPAASRKEVFQNVPSHYESAASMFGALKQHHGFSLKEFRASIIGPAPEQGELV